MAAATKNTTPATGRDESGTTSGATVLGVWLVIVMVRKRTSTQLDSATHVNNSLHVQPEASGAQWITPFFTSVVTTAWQQ